MYVHSFDSYIVWAYQKMKIINQSLIENWIKLSRKMDEQEAI